MAMGPLQDRNEIDLSHRAWAILVGAAALTLLAACDLPLGLGLPTTRALESGAAGSLTGARSFQITGSYSESGTRWSFDLQLSRPATEHVVLTAGNVQLEAVVTSANTYFRGQQFLSDHLGSDLLSRNLVKAAGNAWWKGLAGKVPQLPDLTDGVRFKQTFLGSVVTQRSDHVSVAGIDAVDLSSARADVYIAAQPPHQLLRVRMKRRVAIDGISDGDLRYSNFDRDFQIAAPSNVIDFTNLSTLPPIYTVVSVDTSGCGEPCVVSALLKNLGGKSGARAPSTVMFSVTDPAANRVVGGCQAQVRPDVGYNVTTTVSCTVSGLNSQQENAALVTATADNPGRG